MWLSERGFATARVSGSVEKGNLKVETLCVIFIECLNYIYRCGSVGSF